MEKITQISKQVYINSSYDYMNFSDFLTKEEENIRLSIRTFLEKEIQHLIAPAIEKSCLTQEIINKLKEIEIFKYFFKKPYGLDFPDIFKGVILAELARIDGSLQTFVLV